MLLPPLVRCIILLKVIYFFLLLLQDSELSLLSDVHRFKCEIFVLEHTVASSSVLLSHPCSPLPFPSPLLRCKGTSRQWPSGDGSGDEANV
ncbi:hypothetical protein EV715DRAFT_295671 [Schizophyllum commune]